MNTPPLNDYSMLGSPPVNFTAVAGSTKAIRQQADFDTKKFVHSSEILSTGMIWVFKYLPVDSFSRYLQAKNK